MADVSCSIRDPLDPYVLLLTRFVNSAITADEIEFRYIALFCHDSTSWPDDLFRAVEEFFFAVDDYVSDDDLRSEVGGIDGEQLRGKAIETLERLDALT